MVKVDINLGDGAGAAGSNSKAVQADAIAVHKLLKGTLKQPEAAQKWWSRCQAVFRWSQYFDGPDRLAPGPVLANGSAQPHVDMQKLILEEKQ